MSTPIVSATMGVMNPLLSKLATLIGDEYTKLKGVRKQASFLMRELGAMKVALEKLELMDDLDTTAKNWRDHVREMSYDMENCIDDFMQSLADGDAKTGFIKKNIKRFKSLGARHRIADQIKELKALAVEANERRVRYKIDDCISSASCVVPVDPRMPAMYKDAAGFVGIDGAKKEIVSWLTDNKRKLKVVSIVGFGGLGKTTLAKQVYDEIGGQFHCKAFLPVSQRFDMAGLLNRLRLKLGMESSCSLDVQYIIDELRVYLADKRYLIVVDDLWDESEWNIISCAFPENGIGSRVIVTTRVEDVARGACCNLSECIYRMKPLKEEDSRMLFFNRVFGSEDGCPSKLKEVSAEILKKCGGLPLAIITVSGLLANCQDKSRSEWNSIRDSLGAKFATKTTMEDMRSILNLSYRHLPPHLRGCFLYLGMYPVAHEIKMHDLVRQWVAEGFVTKLHGSDLEDTAKGYFKELINRSMIIPEDTFCGEVLSCKVHDMMLDFILSKCAEENFMSVAYNYEDMVRLHGCQYKVRRMSLRLSAGGTVPGSIATNLSQVRSFAQFGESTYTPPVSLFKYLRVLVFEFPWSLNTTVDLTSIGQLFQLRYLKISAESGTIKLPTEIQVLIHLETLEIYGKLAQSIPSDIVLLPHLSRLILLYDMGLPNGIRSMKSLHTLHCFQMGKGSLQDIKGLGELTNLQDLRLTKDYECDLAAPEADALASSIENLHELKFLSLHSCPPEHYDDQLYSLSNPPLHIEELYLPGWPFKGVPKWIGDLHCLCCLNLFVSQFSTDDVHVVGKLPSLVNLGLKVLHIPHDRAATVCIGLFPLLEFLELHSQDDDVTACMGFAAGAMPMLRELDLAIGKRWGGATPVGMEHLLCLKQIYLPLAWSEHALAMESAFRNAAQVHPSRPSVVFR